MSKHNLYLGQAGQNYVMSEFLKRGYNVAVPQVDVGDDMFVVEDKSGLFQRVQVKTSVGQATNYGFSARFGIPLKQLSDPVTPELLYTLVVDFEQKWQPVLLISREDLFELYKIYDIGAVAGSYLLLYFKFKSDFSKVLCSKVSFLPYLENWDDFPVISH